jgi:integral membrane protein (TIGR00529 family)
MVRELIAMAAAFAFLIYASNRTRLWHGVILLLTGAIMSVLAGQGAGTVASNFTSILLSTNTMKTISVILQIGILSCLMKHYGILDKLVLAFQEVFTSERTIMMLLPAAIGMLSVPGGAQLSSPFVYQLGETVHMPVSQRAAVNLSFRHIAYFLLPTSSSMIIFSSLAPHISLYKLIGLNLGYAFLMQLTSYLCYLSGYAGTRRERSPRFARGMKDILKYLFPIYLVVILNGIFGVQMCYSVFASLMCILLVWGRKDVKSYGRIFVESISLKVFVMMLGVFFMQNTIRGMDGIMNGFAALFSQYSGFSSLLVIAAAAIFFGFTTGLSYVPLGVIVPLILGLRLPPSQELLYCFTVYAWSFMGYYFSPLHLCQLLTVEQMECGSSRLYRTYLPLALVMFSSGFVLFYAYKLLLGA